MFRNVVVVLIVYIKYHTDMLEVMENGENVLNYITYLLLYNRLDITCVNAVGEIFRLSRSSYKLVRNFAKFDLNKNNNHNF